MANTQQMASAIRALAMDAVQQANSGHPGAPMGMADMAVALWGEHLSHNPGNPNWLNRDRFVLSNGHGSMLIYALLHLTGYKLPMSELKNFRQLAPRPLVTRSGPHPGVETTTGPWTGHYQCGGHGVGRSCWLRVQPRRATVVDHHTYVHGRWLLMEGISHEPPHWPVLEMGKLIGCTTTTASIDGQVAPGS